ncbi:MAG: CDP-diacylglycerol--serine O-phosphatidyltransferase [Desulfovermiculus sp.]|nr:CDP-diacylglycerol--serine O-phosphatidyltransferase [Desulfovermiculus sp.]
MPQPRYKGIYILPNLFTTASLFAGFMGLLWAVQGQFELCASAILVSCLCDGLDGKVARLTKASSEFGIQLDSLVDLVAFGVTPAAMIYLWQTHYWGRIGLVVPFLYLACGALRLARFNVQAMHSAGGGKKFFIGLPIPAAACVMATLVLFVSRFPADIFQAILPAWSLGLTLILALLMVSKVRYASFNDLEVVRAHPYTMSITVVLLFVLVASEPKILGFLFFLAYLFSGLVYTYAVLPLRRGTFLRGLTSR